MSNKIDKHDTQPLPLVPDTCEWTDAYMTEAEARAYMGLDIDTFRITVEQGVERIERNGEPFYSRVDVTSRQRNVLAAFMRALFGGRE